jgi:hypothetical protein
MAVSPKTGLRVECSFDVAPRSTMGDLITEVYSVRGASEVSRSHLDPQRLALLFIILAIGSLHNLELPANDPSADEYLELAKRSLSKSDFLTHCTIAGIQTLVRKTV